MSDELQNGRGMSPATAQRLEYAIIGIGMLALLMIFQPFSIALFTAALCAGATFPEAAEISNHASGVVVSKLGTATLTPEELIASFEKNAA